MPRGHVVCFHLTTRMTAPGAAAARGKVGMLASLEQIRRAEQQARTRIAEAESAAEAARAEALQQAREAVRRAAEQAEAEAGKLSREAEELVQAGRDEAAAVAQHCREGVDAALRQARALITGAV